MAVTTIPMSGGSLRLTGMLIFLKKWKLFDPGHHCVRFPSLHAYCMCSSTREMPTVSGKEVMARPKGTERAVVIKRAG